MRPRVALIVSLGLLAGCATQPLVYNKPGVTEAQRKRDENECLRAAVGGDQSGQVLFGVYRLDRAAYARCMEVRGYALQRK